MLFSLQGNFRIIRKTFSNLFSEFIYRLHLVLLFFQQQGKSCFLPTIWVSYYFAQQTRWIIFKKINIYYQYLVNPCNSFVSGKLWWIFIQLTHWIKRKIFACFWSAKKKEFSLWIRLLPWFLFFLKNDKKDCSFWQTCLVHQ